MVANGRRAAAPFAPQFPFGLQPVFAVTAVLPATGVKQLVGPTRDLIAILLFVDEHQLMLIEVRQPFLPAYWSETGDSWEVEPDTRRAVIDRDSGRSGSRRFPGRRFGPMHRRPASDVPVISRRLKANAGRIDHDLPGQSCQPIGHRGS